MPHSIYRWIRFLPFAAIPASVWYASRYWWPHIFQRVRVRGRCTLDIHLEVEFPREEGSDNQ